MPSWTQACKAWGNKSFIYCHFLSNSNSQSYLLCTFSDPKQWLSLPKDLREGKGWKNFDSRFLFHHLSLNKHTNNYQIQLFIYPQAEVEVVIWLCFHYSLMDAQSYSINNASLGPFYRNLMKAVSAMNEFLVMDLNCQHPDTTLKNWPWIFCHVMIFLMKVSIHYCGW